jgi:hypothetical protein
MKALIRVGRLYDSEPIPEGETRYQRGCMHVLPGRSEPIPVVVDHRLERQIGVVDEIIELDCTDGAWLAFRCTLHETPSWLRKGTGASAGYKVLHRQQLGAGERIADAILDEVTVVVGQTPVNAGASGRAPSRRACRRRAHRPARHRSGARRPVSLRKPAADHTD